MLEGLVVRRAVSQDLFGLEFREQWSEPLPHVPEHQPAHPLGRKPAAVRADVAKLSRLAATYVRASDAYQIDEAELLPLGGTRRSSVLKAPPSWRDSSPYQDQDGSGLPYPNPGGAPRRHLRPQLQARGVDIMLRQRRSCCASEHPGQRTPT